MNAYFLGLATAVWLGILTSISPCPLTTNIAAISFLGRKVSSPRMVVLTGLVYVTGRIFAYVVLGIIIVESLLSIPELSFILQNNLNKFLGPVLILAGIFLLGVFRFTIPGIDMTGKLGDKLGRNGVWGAMLLGVIFALSFCPISAALFFGSLIPLALKHHSGLVFPGLYGIGTGLPVIVFALLVAMGAGYIGRVFNRLTQFEKWARRITGIIFILVGLYYSLIYIFGISI